MSKAASFFEFEPLDKKGEPFPLSQLKGKVVLAVNTASKCGFTPQYKDLEELYKAIQAQEPDRFVILGFPCNQFGSQEPGSNDDIQSFCQINYGVTFPVLGKLDVNGSNAAPIFEWMKKEQPGLMGMKRIKWNFEKFLISAEGNVAGRWSSLAKPDSIKATILEEIEKAKKAGVPVADAKPTATTTAPAPAPAPEPASTSEANAKLSWNTPYFADLEFLHFSGLIGSTVSLAAGSN